jgi:hypothetical protein
MILAELNTYLAQHQRVALAELSQRFGSDPEVLRSMLAVLNRKGRVRKMPVGTVCDACCTKCDPASVEIYEWVTNDPAAPSASGPITDLS